MDIYLLPSHAVITYNVVTTRTSTLSKLNMCAILHVAKFQTVNRPRPVGFCTERLLDITCMHDCLY